MSARRLRRVARLRDPDYFCLNPPRELRNFRAAGIARERARLQAILAGQGSGTPKSRAKSTIPRLSETDNSARRTRTSPGSDRGAVAAAAGCAVGAGRDGPRISLALVAGGAATLAAAARGAATRDRMKTTRFRE